MSNVMTAETENDPWASMDGDTSYEASGEGGDEPMTFVTFELGGQWFAVSVDRVREILDRQPVTPLPQAPHSVEGVIDVRGVGVIVFDLTGRLGLARMEETEESRFLVFEFPTGDEDRTTAICVKADRVLEVSQILDDVIEATPDAGIPWDRNIIQGITRNGERIVVLLDFMSVFPFGEVTGQRNSEDIFDFDAA